MYEMQLRIRKESECVLTDSGLEGSQVQASRQVDVTALIGMPTIWVGTLEFDGYPLGA